MKQLRWIVFDAVGTLIEAAPDVATAYGDVGRKFGVDLPRDEIRSRFKAAFAESECDDLGESDRQLRLRTSEALEEKRWRRIVRQVLPEATDLEACFRELFAHFGSPNAWRCFDDVASCFERLSGSGFRFAIASNFDARLHPLCDGLEPLPLIERRFVSSEIGFRKPATGFFRTLLEDLGCLADEILFVGDDWANDVAGPRQLGISAMLLDRANRFVEIETCRVQSLTELAELILSDGWQENRA